MSEFSDFKRAAQAEAFSEPESMPDREFMLERFELVRGRVQDIIESGVDVNAIYKDFFVRKAEYIDKLLVVYDALISDEAASFTLDDWKVLNTEMYEDILPENYEKSFSNPDYTEEVFGTLGKAMSYLSAELATLGVSVFDRDIFRIVTLLELFLEVLGLFEQDRKPTVKSVEEAVYYYAFDYVTDFTASRVSQMYIPEKNTAMQIVMSEDLEDLRYLYKYGEYITSDEIESARFMNSLSGSDIERMADNIADGFRRGFEVMRIPFNDKEYAAVRYHIGHERLVRALIRKLRMMGIDAVIFRTASSRVIRGSSSAGYVSTPANKQFDYDHRFDDAIFMDGRFADKRINAMTSALEMYKSELSKYAGPIIIETFGEEPFMPQSKDSACDYTDPMKKLSRDMNSSLRLLSDKYMPGDTYSYTIVAYPLPSIAVADRYDDERFRDIFMSIMEINTLDNDRYIAIQQKIIDVLDKGDYVTVEGMNGNRTKMHVSLRHLDNPSAQTQFENCTADVNIPLGEVFTSPVLKGTSGVLNVSGVYLNGLFFKNLVIHFEDGMVTDYACDNYISDSATISAATEKGKKYIEDNILFNHKTLPIGEFAIGTNTKAYSMARQYGIISKLPILIVEKMGPHFAVGDTCYSHAEDKTVFNPDGKEIISRENDFSLLRKTDPSKAYFNCHTDITIPYNELGKLSVVSEDGETTDIIRNGRFVLPGTEELSREL